MSRRLPGINAELAAAVRQVNAAFTRLPAEAQGRATITVDGLDLELDAACAAGDRARALAAVRAWRGHNLDRIERAAR